MPEINKLKQERFICFRLFKVSVHCALALLFLDLWWGRASWQGVHENKVADFMDFQCSRNSPLQGRHLWKGSLMVWDIIYNIKAVFWMYIYIMPCFLLSAWTQWKINNKSITSSELLEETAYSLLFPADGVRRWWERRGSVFLLW